MRKKILVALAAAALAVAPLSATPAQASDTHICNIFAPPYDDACLTVVRLFCKLTPTSPICR